MQHCSFITGKMQTGSQALWLIVLFLRSYKAQTSEGENWYNDDAGGACMTRDTDQEGTCVEMPYCNEAVRALSGPLTESQQYFLHQRMCRFEDETNTPYICCLSKSTKRSQPQANPQPTTIKTTPATPKDKFQELSKVCGTSKAATVRVVGGTPAVLGAWPWMAAIFVRKNRNSVNCGGVLISDQYILTAAHCVINKTTGAVRQVSEYTVRLGDLDIDTDSDGATPVEFHAAELIPHKEYNRRIIKNDIALIKLDKPVAQFTDNIRPICLPAFPPMSTDKFVGRSPYIAGWGTVSFRGPSSSSLRQVMLKVDTNEACQNIFKRFKVNITENQLCAGFMLGGKDACQGDSGGPLMLNSDKNKWHVIGVVSVGYKCALPGYSGIYTRTTSYIDWIKTNAKLK